MKKKDLIKAIITMLKIITKRLIMISSSMVYKNLCELHVLVLLRDKSFYPWMRWMTWQISWSTKRTSWIGLKRLPIELSVWVGLQICKNTKCPANSNPNSDDIYHIVGQFTRGPVPIQKQIQIQIRIVWVGWPGKFLDGQARRWMYFPSNIRF